MLKHVKKFFKWYFEAYAKMYPYGYYPPTL